MCNTLIALLLALKFANVLTWDWIYVVFAVCILVIINAVGRYISKKAWLAQMEKNKDELKGMDDKEGLLTMILGLLVYRFF